MQAEEHERVSRETEALGGFQVQEQVARKDPGTWEEHTQKEHILRSLRLPRRLVGTGCCSHVSGK